MTFKKKCTIFSSFTPSVYNSLRSRAVAIRCGGCFGKNDNNNNNDNTPVLPTLQN